ncbi:MAG: BREX-1 system adenine-specific DNA-methyltransferase PglX, partial [Tissierellia bacterium]|nr:BREX-1 system adenine-specific DNA-methyltransferase PglX [Tissierellia bacterium]
LLLTISYTDPEGVVYKLIEDLGEEPFDINKTGQIEVIGWLYQYYNTVPKEEVDAAVKKNKKVDKNTLPAKTQLFTPEWIVKYMVQNSLGRLWIERKIAMGSSKSEEELAKEYGWEYYLPEAEQTEEVKVELKNIRKDRKNLRVEDIKFIDPSMGSGHILVYAFDMFMQFYLEEGYTESEAAESIIENNLYGLDIDKRAYQLAYFSLMMKGRQYSRRILNKGLKNNLYYFIDSKNINRKQIGYLGGTIEDEDARKELRDDILGILDLFKDARELGSIIRIEKEYDYDKLIEFIKHADDANALPMELVGIEETQEKLMSIMNLTKILSNKYEIVVTNPPYLGRGYMGANLTKYLDKKYKNTKADLFAVFMEKCEELLGKSGYYGMINQHSWMFLASFEKYRERLLLENNIINMLHLGPRAFEEIGGEVVQSTAFIMMKNKLNDYICVYIRLVDFGNAREKEIKALEAIENPDCGYYYETSQDNYKLIPGSPIAYWASNAFINIFQNKTLKDYSTIITGMTTGNNNLYLRFWHEVDINKINFNQWDMDSIDLNEKCWIPYNKGGPRRNWYGNNEYIVNWGQHEHFNRAKTTLKHLYLRKGITWPFVTSGDFSARFFGEGFLWDVAGSPCFFHDDNTLYYCLGFMCTKLCNQILKTINPTINVQAVDLEKLPIIYSKEYEGPIIDLVKENIKLSKDDWDSYERSWDFKAHPLVRGQLIVEDGQLRRRYKTIEEAFNNWKEVSTNRFNRLKANEEELNNIFNHIYGLEAEISPYVEDEYITVSVADRERDIKSFISYAIGCILGRYSLDVEGIAYAGGAFDINRYKIFPVEEDNILPVNSEPYFQNDAVFKLIDFVRTLFGEEKLSENLQYIAEALGIRENETPRDTIRRYLLNDFYKDHVQAYNNRPIYWMFTSGKQKAFNALIYMHRYHSSTLSKLRIDYLHVLQARLEGERLNLVKLIEDMESSREKRQIEKEISQLEKQIIELKKYDDKLHHLADMMIEIDLDDGVRSNYGKFKGLLERI